MKIRINNNSLRLRITLRELETLAAGRSVERSMQVITLSGMGPRLDYSLSVEESRQDSDVTIQGLRVSVLLSPSDFRILSDPHEEGVYLKRECKEKDGTTHRFMAFVEKDRPGSTCEKKEQWIYDAPPHGEQQVRPIPKL
jgi:hypothetical protein